jgi:hypothetical protein
MAVDMTTAGTMVATRWPAALQRVTLGEQGEQGADGFHRSWIMLFPQGEFQHPQYGELNFTHAKLADIKNKWEQHVRHIDVALDVDHKANDGDSRATGWIEQLQLRDPSPDGQTPAGLWALIKWTPYGLQRLKDDEFRYFSPDFGRYEDAQSGEVYEDVLNGGALTNRPFLKVIPAIKLADGTAVSRKPWGSVKKSMLPRSAFLDQGDPDKKSTWRLPVYEGTGPKDADGCYTQRGPLNINAVRAALAALGGARTGTAMTGVPAGVKAKLQGWLKRYGATAGAATQASESIGARTMAKTKAPVDTELELDEESAQLFADDAEEYDEAEPEEMADPGDDDSAGPDAEDEDNSGEDDNAFDPNADRHGAMSVKSHTHGKYVGHGHSNDGSHDGVPASDSKSASDRKGLMGAKTAVKTTAEPQSGMTTRQLAEMKRLQDELATVRYTLYETQVGKTLDGWRAQTFQFRDNPKGSTKSGRVALSKAFTETYREFMLKDGYRLSESNRSALNNLIELALSTAIVDLSERGSSYTQDAPGGGRAPGSGNDSDKVQERAMQLAAAQYSGKQLSDLSDAQQMALYMRAESEIGYK